MYSDSFSWITLLPHKRVTQRQDPLMGKCLDIQFYDIFLMGNSCFQTLAIRVVPGAWSQFTGNCPSSLAKLSHVFCLDSLVVTTSVHFGRVRTAHVFLCWGQTKIGGLGLVDLNFLPTCVLHGGTSTCLRVNFNLLCAIWADGYTAQINLKTQSKPMVWSDAYKCCFFFCLLYEMCYFALSLLKNTFLKKQIMWMFTVYGLVFFCYSPRK